MSNKDKINFDTDFLDQVSKEKPKEKPKSDGSKDPNWVFRNGNNKGKNPLPAKKEHPLKVWAWGIGIVVVLGLIGAFSGGSSTSSTSSSGTTYVSPNTIDKNGYTCSSYDSQQADSLDPDPNNTTVRAIDTDEAALNQRSVAIDQESNRIDAEQSYADQATYNVDVAAYNASLQQYKADAATLSNRISAYNTSEAAHNNYLASHCTKD
jgi:hypothetical protein